MNDTLHDALNKYAEHIPETNAHGTAFQRCSVVRRLKEHHDDIELMQLDFAACRAMIDFWRRRPESSRTGKPIAQKTARNFVSELTRFFRWLNRSSQFVWQAPQDLDDVPRQIFRLASDRKLLPRNEFTLEHLDIMYHHAEPMQKLMLCLAMNCGLGAAQMGRLKLDDFQFGGAADLCIDLAPNEGLIRFVRPRTGVFCEWLLWPETVETTRWAIGRAKELGVEYVCVSDSGKPLWTPGSRNPASVFTNHWTRLLRSLKDQSVPSLPFKTIRGQMADLLHREHGSDVAGMYLGNAPVLASYFPHLDRRFRHLHEALRELRASLAPVFEEPDD